MATEKGFEDYEKAHRIRQTKRWGQEWRKNEIDVLGKEMADKIRARGKHAHKSSALKKKMK